MIPRGSGESPWAKPRVMSVSELNRAVAQTLERSFPLGWIAGEISNFTRAASGHWYFTLKDDGAQVRAVMFRGRAQFADFSPREGDRVEVRAQVSLYAPRGDYQLNVDSIRRAGVGNLYEAFVRLKEKLAAEGLFDAGRKKAIPEFVRCVGIVTSPQAAALRDVLAALRRRAPHVRVILYPAPVQGEGAGQKIAQAIATAEMRDECDVLLVVRGGGSIEDLWSFNEEIVARTIAGCALPVIVGVGHETDFTIADFAADLRAPTPTAAAELATIPLADWQARLAWACDALRSGMRRRQAEAAQSVDWLARRLVSPSAVIRHERLKLAGLQNRLEHATRAPLRHARYRFEHLRTRLAPLRPDTAAQRSLLADCVRRMTACKVAQRSARKHALSALSAQLEMLNPQRTLERGYAIVTDAQGAILRSPAGLRANQRIALRLAEGSADVDIASVQQKLE